MWLALDLGAQCGWATYNDERRIWDAGLWKLQGKRDSHIGSRMIVFRKYLSDVIPLGPHVVCYEKVRRHLGTAAAHAYGAYESAVLEWSECVGIPAVGIEVGAVKKQATGHGRATKAAVLEAARQRWTWLAIPTDDVADALWILATAREHVGAIPTILSRGQK